MSTHGYSSRSEGSKPIALTPVEQDERLQYKAATHDKDIGHVVQTRSSVAKFKRYKYDIHKVVVFGISHTFDLSVCAAHRMDFLR